MSSAEPLPLPALLILGALSAAWRSGLQGSDHAFAHPLSQDPAWESEEMDEATLRLAALKGIKKTVGDGGGRAVRGLCHGCNSSAAP